MPTGLAAFLVVVAGNVTLREEDELLEEEEPPEDEELDIAPAPEVEDDVVLLVVDIAP